MTDYAITLPDGREILVDAPNETAARTAANNFLMREGRSGQGKKGGVDNFGRALARGASFGFSDEFAAAADATVGPAVDWALGKVGLGKTNTSTAPTWSERYTENLGGERAQDKAYDSEFPVWSTVGKAGGVLGTVPLMPSYLLAGGIPRAAAVGAGMGAVGGFGEGEGGFVDRAISAVPHAALGGATGVALPLATRAIGAGGRMLAESRAGRAVADKYIGPGLRYVADKLDDMAPKVKLGSLSAAAPDDGRMVPADSLVGNLAQTVRQAAPTGANILDDAAVRRIADTVARGGDDVASISSRLDDLGPGAMPLDINPMTQRLGRTAYISPGGAPKVINTALDARNRSTGPRFSARALGDEANAPSIFDAKRFLDANRRNVGRTAYGAMDDAGLKQTPELMALYENPEVMGAIDRVMAAEKRARIGRPNAQPASPVEIMHMVKQELQGLGYDKMSGKPLSTQQAWRDLADEYVRLFKVANPEAARADRAYAEAASLPEWLDRGRNFMRGGTSEAADDVSVAALAADLPTATPAQGLSFRVGSTNTIKDAVAQGPDATRRLAKSIDQNEILRQKLTEIYGPDRAEAMMRAARSELELARTDRVVRGGPDTASKLLSALDEAASGEIPTSANSIVSRLLAKAADAYNKGKAGNEAVRERIARMLTETDAGMNAELLDKIAEQLAKAKRARPGQRATTAAIGQQEY